MDTDWFEPHWLVLRSSFDICVFIIIIIITIDMAIPDNLRLYFTVHFKVVTSDAVPFTAFQLLSSTL